jgi:hypothetical protein
MITIKQRENKWRVEFENEQWEASTIEELKELTEYLAKLKEKYGKAKKYEDR